MATTRRYAEKLNAAVYALAVREGDVRERLKGAYFYLRQLNDTEVPEEARAEFQALLHALTRRGPEVGPDGEIYSRPVENTLRHLRNATGRRYAERVFALYRETLR